MRVAIVVNQFVAECLESHGCKKEGLASSKRRVEYATRSFKDFGNAAIHSWIVVVEKRVRDVANAFAA